MRRSRDTSAPLNPPVWLARRILIYGPHVGGRRQSRTLLPCAPITCLLASLFWELSPRVCPARPQTFDFSQTVSRQIRVCQARLCESDMVWASERCGCPGRGWVEVFPGAPQPARTLVGAVIAW